MPNTNPQRVYDLLHRMPTEGLNAARRLFWTELNYDHAADTLSTRDWPEGTRALLAAAPTLLAQHSATLGAFDVVYIPLASEQTGRSFPLSLVAERAVIAQLLPNHPYALFVFSDAAEKHWHLVNVKYRRDKAGEESAARRILRRIAIGPHERLRTAAERIAMLDLTTLSPNLFGLSPIAIQQRHDDAFDVEAVTKAFFTTYREHFERVEAQITGLAEAEGDVENVRIFTQRLFNRLLFIVFLERKGWLIPPDTGKSIRADGYLAALWDAHRHPSFHSGQAPSLHSERHSERSEESQRSEESNFYRDRLKLLFFSGLNNPGSIDITGIKADGPLVALIGRVPYLNGGLFEKEDLDERDEIAVPDAVFRPLFDDLLYHYNFTVTESTPLDVEVAVDPEMLGKIFEELVTGRHETGSYYTPKPVVAFMCREALKGYLRDVCPRESITTIAAFVEERDAADIRQPEAILAALRAVKVCDLACGSGAYLLGMLHELMELRQALFVSRHLDARSAYERKLEIIQHSLYGVDIDPFAVNIARLRLWLSLIVDYDGDDPPPLPNLEFKIEVGDSLTAPAPAPLQADLFRQKDVEDFFALKGQFMTAHGPQKKALRAQIDALKATIAEWASEESGADAFDWAVDFAEVFTPPPDAITLRGGMAGLLNATPGQMQLTPAAAPGFDIIVANPPYVRQELLGSDLKAKLKKRYPDVYTGAADLYVYFYARALHLLREGGNLAFISSNKWFRATYGAKLRQHIATTCQVQSITDFGELPVFETAATFPMIFVAQKRTPDKSRVLFTQVKSLEPPYPDVLTLIQQEGQLLPSGALNGKDWTLTSAQVADLLHKMETRGIPLSEYVDGRIYRGVVTGFNKAFIIDAAQRAELIAQDAKSAEIIKPFVVGNDVRRWRIEYKDKWMIVMRIGVDIARYPAILAHLQQWQPQLEKRWDKGSHWWELRACDYYDRFDKPKIIYPDIAKESRFTLDISGMYFSNTTYFIASDSLYLLGVLNSKIVWFYAKENLSVLGDANKGGRLRFFTQFVEQIPIPDPTAEHRAAIEGMVRHLLDARGQGPQVSAWEAELNALVYQVYGLMAEEIRVVEGGEHG